MRSVTAMTFATEILDNTDVPTDLESYSQATAVEDAAAVLDSLRIAKAHIVGLSMGGFAAVHFGLRFPERALSLTVAGAGYGCEKEFGGAESDARSGSGHGRT